MAEADSDRRQVDARIVYWGVEGAGKATNLRTIHAKLRPDHRGRLDAVPTRLDPSVCWYRLPIELGEIAGVRTRIQVIATPGGPEQAPTRKQLLDRVDGVVFVVDARRERIDENVAALEELRSVLGAYGRSLEQVPLVVQCNRQDQSDPFVLEELHRKLNVRGAAVFEAVATEGKGVLTTLTTISKRVVRQLREDEAERIRPAPAPEPEPGPAAPATPARAATSAGPEPTPLATPAADPGRATMLLLDPAPPPVDLERAALAPGAEREDERDQAVTRAQGMLDASFYELTTHEEAGHLAATGLLDAESWQITAVGEAAVTAARSVELPLVLADASGAELRFRLTLSLDPLLDP